MPDIPAITEVPDLAVISLPELMQELHEVEAVQANDYPWFSPPFHYVPMPLNVDGNGPEMDESKVTRTEHQVWNAECEVVAVCPSEQVARFVAQGLRRVRPPSASDDVEIEASGGDRAIADLLVEWQTGRSEWFESTTLEIVAEYAAWRETRDSVKYLKREHSFAVRAIETALEEVPWIEHSGHGDPPRDYCEFVQVRFRDGDTSLGIRWDWDQNWSWASSAEVHNGDIVAYRALPGARRKSEVRTSP